MKTSQSYYYNITLIIFLFFSFIFKGYSQNILYVNLHATGNNDGSSWTNAFLELQDAINAANTGDAIWVAAGTYYPTVTFDADNSGATTNQEQTFYINKNIKLYGQFNGSETMLSQRNKANMTILSGDLGSPQNTTDNAFHVVFIDGTSNNGIITDSTTLDGFIIEQGAATGNNFPNDAGAGIFINGRGTNNQCNPILVNLSLRNNSANAQGGAIYNDGSQGGVCNTILNQIFFHSNTAQNGGAIYNNGNAGRVNFLINENKFVNNSASQSGAAVYNLATNNGQINNSVVASLFNNHTANNGAVYYNNGTLNGGFDIKVYNSTFEQNRSLNNGGVFYSESSISNCNIDVNNSKFNNNISTHLGGVFFNDNSANTILTMNISLNKFKGNSANSGGICYSTTNQFSNQEITFNENTVDSTIVNGNGGAFYNSGDLNASLNMNIEGNTFSSSNANNGGVFYHNISNNTNMLLFLEKNTFTGNNASNGAVSFLNTASNANVSLFSIRNTYVFNTASNKGGVFFNSYSTTIGKMALINDIVHANSNNDEGVIYHKGEANSSLLTKIVNCTFNENYAASGARSISNIAVSSNNVFEISNSIFSHSGGNTPQINTIGGQTQLTYSLYNDGNPDGTVVLPAGVTGNNNIDGDPLFNSEPAGDLTLTNLSPAINAGNNDSLPPSITEDNIGQPRIYSISVDMGALEYNNSLYTEALFIRHVSCSGLTNGIIPIKILGTTPPLTINGIAANDPTFAQFPNLGAGTYQYNFLDGAGRTDTLYVTITEPSPITLSSTSLSSGIASVTANGGTAPYSYLWDDSNAQSTAIATGLSNGTYTVTVTDANGCSAINTVTVNLATSYKELATNSTIIIAPNPSSGQVQLTFNLEEETSIQPVLYNLQGQLVHEFDRQSGLQINYTENLSTLSAGTYFLKTTINNQHITQPLILKH